MIPDTIVLVFRGFSCPGGLRHALTRLDLRAPGFGVPTAVEAPKDECISITSIHYVVYCAVRSRAICVKRWGLTRHEPPGTDHI